MTITWWMIPIGGLVGFITYMIYSFVRGIKQGIFSEEITAFKQARVEFKEDLTKAKIQYREDLAKAEIQYREDLAKAEISSYRNKNTKIRDFCVQILNFLKGLSFYYPFIMLPFTIIAIPFDHLIMGTEIGAKIVHIEGISIACWVVGFVPIYWCLLIIQWIMTVTWNNKDDYFNVFEMWARF